MIAPTKAQPLRRVSDEPLREIREAGSDDHEKLKAWFSRLEAWGKRVRRDIINLEEFLRRKYPEFQPGEPPTGGDPGDPPHGPW